MFGFCAKVCAPHGDPVTMIRNESQNTSIKTNKMKTCTIVTHFLEYVVFTCTLSGYFPSLSPFVEPKSVHSTCQSQACDSKILVRIKILAVAA